MPYDDDIAAIEALRRRDEKAAMAQDSDALAALWSKDGVMLAPGGPRLRGRELFDALAARTPDAGTEILDYRFDFEEVVVSGDYAFEWGTVRGRSRDRATGEVTDSAYQLMRVLTREDGEWTVHRAIWNALD